MSSQANKEIILAEHYANLCRAASNRGEIFRLFQQSNTSENSLSQLGIGSSVGCFI